MWLQRINLIGVIFLVLACGHMAFLSAQVTFQKTYGGGATDLAHAVQVTADSGFIVAGYTLSFGAGNRDVILIRMDKYGNTVWANVYGGSSTDYAWTVDQTADGGFVFGAHSESYGAGGHDIMLVKTDGSGDIGWIKYYGGSSADGAYSLQTTFDGGMMVAAHTNSFGQGAHEVFLLKTDANGDTIWAKSYGAGSQDYLQGVYQTADGGFVAAAYSAGFGAGSNDFYLLHTNSTGDTLWTQAYGGPASDVAYSLQEISGGGFIVGGYTNSFGAGSNDFYLMRLDAAGQVVWSKTYGGSGADFCYAVRETSDGGFVAAGQTFSFGSNGDVYLVRTDGEGNLIWSYAYGGDAEDHGWSVKQTPDDGFVIAGFTGSFGGGGQDVYIIKTDADGISGCHQQAAATISNAVQTTVSNTNTAIRPGAIESPAGAIQVSTIDSEDLLCQNITFIPQEKLENQEFQLFPNPFKRQVKLKVDNIESYPGGISLQIFDILGRRVRHIEGIRSKNMVIDRGNLTAGFYIYKLVYQNRVLKTGKIIFAK